jgi:hypothetical protein
LEDLINATLREAIGVAAAELRAVTEEGLRSCTNKPV